jgi:hypothetical protein
MVSDHVSAIEFAEGAVASLNVSAKQLTVKSQDRSLDLKIKKETIVQSGGKPTSLSNLTVGARVRVQFVRKGSKLEAVMLEFF